MDYRLQNRNGVNELVNEEYLVSRRNPVEITVKYFLLIYCNEENYYINFYCGIEDIKILILVM